MCSLLLSFFDSNSLSLIRHFLIRYFFISYLFLCRSLIRYSHRFLFKIRKRIVYKKFARQHVKRKMLLLASNIKNLIFRDIKYANLHIYDLSLITLDLSPTYVHR